MSPVEKIPEKPREDEVELDDIRAKENAKRVPKRERPLNRHALVVLRQRCFEEKAKGVANIAVSVDLLIELFSGTLHAEKHGFSSELTV